MAYIPGQKLHSLFTLHAHTQYWIHQARSTASVCIWAYKERFSAAPLNVDVCVLVSMSRYVRVYMFWFWLVCVQIRNTFTISIREKPTTCLHTRSRNVYNRVHTRIQMRIRGTSPALADSDYAKNSLLLSHRTQHARTQNTHACQQHQRTCATHDPQAGAQIYETNQQKSTLRIKFAETVRWLSGRTHTFAWIISYWFARQQQRADPHCRFRQWFCASRLRGGSWMVSRSRLVCVCFYVCVCVWYVRFYDMCVHTSTPFVILYMQVLVWPFDFTLYTHTQHKRRTQLKVFFIRHATVTHRAHYTCEQLKL